MTRDKNPMLVNDFLSYLENVKGKSRLTVEEYELDLRIFFRFMKQYKEIVPKTIPFEEIDVSDLELLFVKKLTLSDIYAYLEYLSRGRGDGARTRARKISAIRSFFKYLQTKVQLIDINPCDNLDSPKVNPTLPRYLSLEECIELLSAVDGKHKERDYCILTLFLNCGMRLSELVGINLSSIKENQLTVLGKGNKERTVYLNESCIEAIASWMEVRGKIAVKNEAKNALFLSQQGNRISNKTVQYIVNKYLEEAGLSGKGYSTHKLRHTAATLMFRDGGVDLRTLQEILGHEQLSTTQIYTHVSDKQLEEAVSKNPLAKIRPKKEKG